MVLLLVRGVAGGSASSSFAGLENVALTVWAPTYGEMERLIVANLHRIRALGAGVVVHLPRSGTAPAGMVATYLPAPLASVEEYCLGIVSTRKCPVFDPNLVILVDDCINTGRQSIQAIESIKKANPRARVTLLAVYDCRREFSPAKVFPFPLLTLANHNSGPTQNYLYPYYIWKSKRIEHVAVDFDGVLCRDATKAEDDDGKNYLRFLANAEPKFIPLGKHTIGAIVTARCQKYRQQTEEWLSRHGVNYKTLHMGPWDSKEERRGKAAAWKANVYAGLGPEISLFIESSDIQAGEINALTGKPVFSVESMVLHE